MYLQMFFVPDSGEGFKCDRCGKVFAYKYYRDKHLKYTRCVDQGDRKFPCHLCNRSFEKRDRLRIHILHVHEKHRPHKVKISSCRSIGYFYGRKQSAVVLKEQLPFRKTVTDAQKKISRYGHFRPRPTNIFSLNSYFKLFDEVLVYKGLSTKWVPFPFWKCDFFFNFFYDLE